jgi:dolichol-phosphate mannosyltransferase
VRPADKCIILPTYNERKNIEPLVRRIAEIVPEARIMVVDDNSPDGTADAVRALANEIPQLKLHLRAGKEGLGKAYMDAFQRLIAEGEVDAAVMMDADFSHDPTHLPALIGLSGSYDLVVGSRYMAGGEIDGWERWRMMLSRGGNFYAGAITGMPISDMTGGFNAIRLSQLKKLDFAGMTCSGYAFQIELKYRLWRQGATIGETPIVFRQRRGGESKISNHIVREGLLAPWKLRFSSGRKK